MKSSFNFIGNCNVPNTAFKMPINHEGIFANSYLFMLAAEFQSC